MSSCTGSWPDQISYQVIGHNRLLHSLPLVFHESMYVNVSDQTAIFTHETKMLISICWKCFLAFIVLKMTKTAGWIQNFKKKRRNSPKKTVPFLLHYFDNLCTSDGSDGTQKWPWAPWQWVGMTFQALRGPSGAKIAFMILLATSIGDTVTQCTAHDKGVTNAVTVGQNDKR